MKIDGGCHCGNITYEAEIDPDKMALCHCTDCQRLSGTAVRTSLGTPEEDFKLLSGTPKTYVKTGHSGAKRAQVFCPDCGAQLYATSVGDGPKVFNLRTGTINQRDQLSPKRQIWHRSSQSWINDLANLPKVDMQ